MAHIAMSCFRFVSMTAALFCLLFIAQVTVANAELVRGGRNGANTLVKTGNAEGHIVGGIPTPITSVPYQIAIYANSKYTGGFRFITCGGTLIAPDIVVSASHCFVPTTDKKYIDFQDYDYYVVAGVDDRSLVTSQNNGVRVAFVVPFSGYTSADMDGKDFTLLFLKRPFKLSSRIQTLRLATRMDEADGSVDIGIKAVISGWGKTSGNSNTGVDRLRSAVLTIKNVATSKPDIMVAGPGASQSAAAACSGDSGGPLAVGSVSSNEWMLAGVTSFGFATCKGSGSYARSSQFIEWTSRMIATEASDGVLTTSVVLGDNLSLNKGQLRSYKLVVPGGLRSLTIQLIPFNEYEGGDADLVVRVPDTVYPCRSMSQSAAESCSFLSPVEGIYTVIVQAPADFGSLRISATMEHLWLPASRTLTFTATVNPFAQVDYLAFPIIPGGDFSLRVTSVTGSTPSISVGSGIQRPTPANTICVSSPCFASAPNNAAALSFSLHGGSIASNVSVEFSYQTVVVPRTSEKWFHMQRLGLSGKAPFDFPDLLVGSEFDARLMLHSGGPVAIYLVGAESGPRNITLAKLLTTKTGIGNFISAIVRPFGPTIRVLVANTGKSAASYSLRVAYSPRLFTASPTMMPSSHPTKPPTFSPSSLAPTSSSPTPKPTDNPTAAPTPEPTKKPTGKPTGAPTPQPTPKPTPQPTKQPTTRAPTCSSLVKNVDVPITEIQSLPANIAVNRACIARGYGGGYDTGERGANVWGLACYSKSQITVKDYPSATQPARFGVHRWAATQGAYCTGFLNGEHGTNVWGTILVPSGQNCGGMDASQATLDSFFPGNTDIAAHRMAKAHGYITGRWNGEIGANGVFGITFFGRC